MPPAAAATLQNELLSWSLTWSEGIAQTSALTNKLTGHTFTFTDSRELALLFSAATDRLAEPLSRVDDFVLIGADTPTALRATLSLRSPSTGLEATLHYALDGPTRRKWAQVTNTTNAAFLLLDVCLDDLCLCEPVTGGGQGQPLFLADEAFAAIEYPSAANLVTAGRLTLTHFPGRVLTPGQTFTSHPALFSVAPPGEATEHFVQYIDQRSLRRREALSIYTPFGINNQWGPCSTLTDEETLHVLSLLESLQRKGVRFDEFTLDTGWVDPASDLTRFRPTSYPDGPGEVVRRVGELGMDFGLWFAVSWGAESCWGNPAAWPTGEAPVMSHLNGCPAKARFTGMLCYGYEPYSQMLKRAVLHHIRENRVRFVKFDGGAYRCDNPDHGHLPGKYSTERMHDSLIDLADAARAAAPGIFVMWYWGLGSPFWALFGDTIFESGCFMEGSGTSATPTLYYRDSVTLAQDQNAHFARLIPPLAKDSLGVWLADTRWGNFMGKERWREALVMDLGRGSLLFPNLWGDLYLLDDDDIAFLAWIANLARDNQHLFLHRRLLGGDPWAEEVYGYAHCQGDRGFLFLSNPAFVSRQVTVRLDESVGLDATPRTPLSLRSVFPDAERILHSDGAPCRAGEELSLWLRPFEVLMLQVGSPADGDPALPLRDLDRTQTAGLGRQVSLQPLPSDPALGVTFAEADQFRQQGHLQTSHAFETTVPDLDGPQPILAVAIRLRQGDTDHKYAPFVARIVQVRARLGDQDLQLVPVPDGRQFGNTQSAGCSWVLYKIRLSRAWSGQPLRLAVHAWLPEGVEAWTEAWLVKRWWREDARPTGDGYYADAPS